MLALHLLQTACAHLMIQRMLGSILSAAQEFGLFIRLSQRLTKRLVPLLRSGRKPHQLQKRGLMETGWHPRKKHVRVTLTSVYINRCQFFRNVLIIENDVVLQVHGLSAARPSAENAWSLLTSVILTARDNVRWSATGWPSC